MTDLEIDHHARLSYYTSLMHYKKYFIIDVPGWSELNTETKDLFRARVRDIVKAAQPMPRIPAGHMLVSRTKLRIAFTAGIWLILGLAASLFAMLVKK